MSDDELYNVACGHLIFEESSTEINEGAAKRLAGLLAKVQEEEEVWWHKRWHQDTGIPCDGVSKYCPRNSR
jgi:hypothetical protein